MYKNCFYRIMRTRGYMQLCCIRTLQMAARVAKYGFIVAVLTLVCVFLYTIKCTSVAKNVHITANQENAQAELLNTRTFYFHVSKFNVINEKLELHGNFNGSEFKRDNPHQMIIGGLETFINDVKPIIWKNDKLENFTMPKQHYFDRNRRVKDVNCQAMIKGDKVEIDRAENLRKTEPKVPYSAEFYINMTSNCSNFIHKRGYIMDPLTAAERDFSVAFSILMYTDIEQSERLLRSIYRPQHWYCFHVDYKTDESIHKAISNIAGCFDNVFVLDRRYDVKWGTMTVLEPEIHCMEELWNKSKTWKYFINLTGQEFPLRTNYELVQILQAYNGANDVEATVKRANKDRWEEAGKPPHGIVPTKGSVHITASRGFVDYILHDQRAKDFLKWTNKTKVPDETFFASLNHNPVLGVPGSYRGLAETDISGDIKPFVSRFKNWGNGQYDWPCEGKRVRTICVFGTGDLQILASRRELFANKFFLDYDHYALDCMEELHFNHTRDEYFGKLQFDVRWYTQLGFVSNKID